MDIQIYYLKNKFQILRYDLRERGLFYALKRMVLFFLRPCSNLIGRSTFLVNLKCGIAPNLWLKLPFSRKTSKRLQLPQSEIMKGVRKFWYSNTPGHFDLDGEKISRKDIFVYGGPNPKFTCLVCQKSEWLSRLRQKNLFISHFCPQIKECEELCKKQGDELWTHFHQNFDFMIGCDANLPAPKCLYLVPKYSYQRFLVPRCDQGPLIGKRRLAVACQADIIQEPVANIHWSKYDFLFMFNDGVNPKFPRPDIPIILYGHDFQTKDKGYQWVIDWVKPEILLTSYPSQWKENFKLPLQTKVVFYPLFWPLNLTRPNLGEKKIDLLVIGATIGSIYRPRRELDKQILPLSIKYKIEFSHHIGHWQGEWKGPTYYLDQDKKPVRYLNKWSEYLASAKYVIFGKIADPKKQFLVYKYYETLASGAVPIFPEVPDLKLLEVKAFEHYIPLSEVEGNNERLRHFLDNYEKYKYIAQNAVNWYKQNENKLFFEGFEKTIREITSYKYPKRLI